mmetsp:Transcript_15083/g.18918  ORF Transcript_15083/g.18918 Transcript_15083/m.18918 type:complete len:84 (-) Transcript_15083:85-336(-)
MQLAHFYLHLLEGSVYLCSNMNVAVDNYLGKNFVDSHHDIALLFHSHHCEKKLFDFDGFVALKHLLSLVLYDVLKLLFASHEY